MTDRPGTAEGVLAAGGIPGRAFWTAYLLFRDPRYWNAFLKVFDFVWNHLINHEVGEWFALLDRDGRVRWDYLGPRVEEQLPHDAVHGADSQAAQEDPGAGTGLLGSPPDSSSPSGQQPRCSRGRRSPGSPPRRCLPRGAPPAPRRCRCKSGLRAQGH